MDYEAETQKFLDQFRNNPSAQASFLQNPSAVLTQAGLPIVSEDQIRSLSQEAISPTMDSGPSAWATTHYWGVNIGFNEQLTQAMLGSATLDAAFMGSIVAALLTVGVITAPIAAVLAPAIIICVAAKYVEVKAVDNGNGVYFPCSWVQLAGLAASVSLGPPGVAAALELFFWAKGS